MWNHEGWCQVKTDLGLHLEEEVALTYPSTAVTELRSALYIFFMQTNYALPNLHFYRHNHDSSRNRTRVDTISTPGYRQDGCKSVTDRQPLVRALHLSLRGRYSARHWYSDSEALMTERQTSWLSPAHSSSLASLDWHPTPLLAYPVDRGVRSSL